MYNNNNNKIICGGLENVKFGFRNCRYLSKIERECRNVGCFFKWTLLFKTFNLKFKSTFYPKNHSSDSNAYKNVAFALDNRLESSADAACQKVID
jgi:hypothetical protein